MVPTDWEKRFGQTMKIEFLTMHRSKDKAADYVVLPGMVNRSFPSIKQDDSVISMAMPDGDSFPFSDERRLFYVALTRARRSVTMSTVRGRHSPFLSELLKEGVVQLAGVTGESIEEEQCPVCKIGVFVDRVGPRGTFKSCSSYPHCENKPKRRA